MSELAGMASLRQKLRPIVASSIILGWMVTELFVGVSNPSVELRVIILSASIWMFGESAVEAIGLFYDGSGARDSAE